MMLFGHGVFDFVADGSPEIIERIRIIDQVGPSPAPPFVIHRSVPMILQQEIRQTMLELGEDETFLARVNHHRLKTIVPIDDSDYQPIRIGYQNSLAL